ncbi:MAG TPA: riboflavin synthase, partial [Blastocatellia bacterium]|nr:riboflavin synthase [Blastocatellia bacterium]
MFTGIIEELGTIRRITPARDGARLEVSARTVLADAKLGDSIAVNGVCLTVVDKGSD